MMTKKMPEGTGRKVYDELLSIEMDGSRSAFDRRLSSEARQRIMAALQTKQGIRAAYRDADELLEDELRIYPQDEAESLEDLLALARARQITDIGHLPKFGGDAPAAARDEFFFVRSWDEGRVLIGVEQADLEIVDRAEWSETVKKARLRSLKNKLDTYEMLRREDVRYGRMQDGEARRRVREEHDRLGEQWAEWGYPQAEYEPGIRGLRREEIDKQQRDFERHREESIRRGGAPKEKAEAEIEMCTAGLLERWQWWGYRPEERSAE